MCYPFIKKLELKYDGLIEHELLVIITRITLPG